MPVFRSAGDGGKCESLQSVAGGTDYIQRRWWGWWEGGGGGEVGAWSFWKGWGCNSASGNTGVGWIGGFALFTGDSRGAGGKIGEGGSGGREEIARIDAWGAEVGGGEGGARCGGGRDFMGGGGDDFRGGVGWSGGDVSCGSGERPEEALFGEGAGRILVEVEEALVGEVERLAGRRGWGFSESAERGGRS